MLDKRNPIRDALKSVGDFLCDKLRFIWKALKALVGWEDCPPGYIRGANGDCQKILEK